MDMGFTATEAGTASLESDVPAWQSLALLPSIRPAALVPSGHRAVIVAPYPGDEVRGTGGLIQGLYRLGRNMLIVAATGAPMNQAGASAPWLNTRAPLGAPSAAGALQRLGIQKNDAGPDLCQVVYADMQAGHLHDQEMAMAAFLAWHLLPGDVVFASWRFDGSTDREALGRAALAAASLAGAKCIPVPLYALQQTGKGAGKMPWHRARRIELDVESITVKRHALAGSKRLSKDDAESEWAGRHSYEIVLI